MVEDWTRAEQNILARSQIHIESPATTLKTLICTLLVANPNWYQYHAGLKGLYNRHRIWKDVEEIIRQICMYRKQGKG